MTKDERALAKTLAAYDKVELHKHNSLNGHNYWKVKVDGRALNCIKISTVERMEQRVGLITGTYSLKYLNVSQLKANLFDWETRKENRKTKPAKKQIVNSENIF